jgi:hypothetical protein
VPKEKCEECKRIALDVIRVLKPTGPGGFDFLFQVGPGADVVGVSPVPVQMWQG